MSRQKKAIGIRLDMEVFDKFKQYCFENHISMTGAITQWVMQSKVANNVHWTQQSMDDLSEKGE